MFSKKVILPFAALAVMGLVACGDDSSSSPSDAPKELPSSVKTIEEAIHQTCTPTENFCAKIFVEEFADTVQCNGKEFTPMMLGKPVEGCEAADPGPAAGEEPGAGEGPAAGEEPGAGEGPAAGEEPGAGEGPAAGEEPGAGEGPAAGEEPGAGEGPAAGDDVVYCVIPGAMGGCEAIPAAMKDQCETLLEGQLVDACPAE